MPTKKKVILSPSKFQELKSELEELKTIGRKVIAKKLEEYRQDGLTEDDSNYSGLLEEKVSIENRIDELTDLLDRVEVKEKPTGCKNIDVGCSVVVKDGSDEKEYDVVSSIEADPSNGKISEESPLGSALLNKKKGDRVDIETPEGKKTLTVVHID